MDAICRAPGLDDRDVHHLHLAKLVLSNGKGEKKKEEEFYWSIGSALSAALRRLDPRALGQVADGRE